MVRTSRFASATSSLQFDEDSDETARVKLMVKGLSGIGLGAVGSDVRVGLMPDQGKRVRHQAIVVATPTSSIMSRLIGVLDGPPGGIIQFHELPGVRILNEPKKIETIFFFGSYISRTTSEGRRMKSRAVFAFCSQRMRANGAPLRDCGCLHEGETEVGECCLFYPPNKIGNGHHKPTVMCDVEQGHQV